MTPRRLPRPVRYEVTMPDGAVRTCDSDREYDSAVAVYDHDAGWRLCGLYSSVDHATRRLYDYLVEFPDARCAVVGVRVVVPLTIPQRVFLRRIRERGTTMLSVVSVVALVKRGLVTRRRTHAAWHVEITDLGRSAIDDQDALDAERKQHGGRA